MKKIISLALAIVAFSFFSCDKNDEIQTPSTLLLTLNFNSDIDLGDERWVIISDLEGEVLSYDKISETGDSKKFYTSKEVIGKINITYLTVKEFSASLNTQTEQIPGQIIEYPFVGEVNQCCNINKNIKIQNIELNQLNNQFFFFASDKSGGIHNFNAYQYNSDTRELDFSISAREVTPDIIVSIVDDEKDPMYAWINEFKESDPLVLNYEADFQTMENVLNLHFPNSNFTSVEISGYRNALKEEKHYLSVYATAMSSKSSKPIKVGYVEGFESYQTYVALSLPMGRYKYIRRGAKSDGINEDWFTGIAEVTNNDLHSFDFNIKSGSFDQIASRWRKTVNTNIDMVWEIKFSTEKSNNKILLKFPNEITDKYPLLSIDGYAFTVAEFERILNNEEKIIYTIEN